METKKVEVEQNGSKATPEKTLTEDTKQNDPNEATEKTRIIVEEAKQNDSNKTNGDKVLIDDGAKQNDSNETNGDKVVIDEGAKQNDSNESNGDKVVIDEGAKQNDSNKTNGEKKSPEKQTVSDINPYDDGLPLDTTEACFSLIDSPDKDDPESSKMYGLKGTSFETEPLSFGIRLVRITHDKSELEPKKTWKVEAATSKKFDPDCEPCIGEVGDVQVLKVKNVKVNEEDEEMKPEDLRKRLQQLRADNELLEENERLLKQRVELLMECIQQKDELIKETCEKYFSIVPPDSKPEVIETVIDTAEVD